MVNFLIENGADVNKTTEIIEFTDEGNSTPLHDAANHEYANIAERLIEAGADVNARDAEGHTPLDIVAGNLLRYRMYLYDREPEKSRHIKLKMFTDTIAVLERHGGRLSHGGTLTEDGANRHREALLQHGAEITKSLASKAFERRKHLLYAWVAPQETATAGAAGAGSAPDETNAHKSHTPNRRRTRRSRRRANRSIDSRRINNY